MKLTKRNKLLLCICITIFVILIFCITVITQRMQRMSDESAGEFIEEDNDTGAGSDEFNWRAHSGTSLRIMFNQHPYADAVIAKLPEFERATGIRTAYSITSEDNYFDRLTTSLRNRSGNPDVFMTGAYQIWEYAPEGYIEPLDEYLNNASKTAADYDFNDFYEGVAGSLRWNTIPGHRVGRGPQWALPMGYEINNLAYNKRILDEIGLNPPRTTQELMEVAIALNGFAGPDSYGIALRGARDWATIHPGYMTLFATWGAQDFAVENGRLVCKLDSPAAIAMTDYWVRLIRAASAPQWPTYTWYQAGADLGAGRAAMLFDASPNGYYQSFPPGISRESGNLRWTSGPLPPGRANSRSNIWVWSLAMNADSNNKDAAWYFIQYFTNREFMLYSGTEGSCVDTPRRSVAESPEYISIVGAAEGYLEALAADVPYATIYFTPQPYFFETTTEWAATLQDIVSGLYPSTEAGMRQLTQRLNRIVGDIRIND